MIQILRLSGDEILPHLEALAALRIRVFREFPYLYAGSLDYERDYLAEYAECPEAVIVLAIKDGKIVGASTGMPLMAADPAFRMPFEQADWPITKIFYFGESVLEPAERGQGIGHRFFDERERHAAGLGYGMTAFCSVHRPADHPLRPLDYRPHNAFWAKRGYEKHPELVTQLVWKQIDADEDVTNRLVFWVRSPNP